MLQVIKNNFTFGEIGERLDANRTSEIYANSAKDITNMTITDLGTLRVAKQFVSTELPISGTVIRAMDIKDSVYIVLTTSHLYQFQKSNNTVKNSWQHDMGDGVDCSLVGRDYVALFNKKSSKKFKLYDINKGTEKKDYFFLNPLKDKKVIELSLVRASKDPLDKEGKRFRITPMAVTKDPKVKIKSGKIYLSNSEIQIKRIYIDYNNYVDETYFSDIVDGDIYGILRIYYKPKEGESYVIDNNKYTIGGLSTDSKYKGQYFTTVSGADADGVFAFGKLVDVANPTYISFYQDRTVFYVNNYMYFSKVRDNFNFRNSTEPDAPFFIQLNPINNRIGDLLGMISSDALIVLTTAGIYSIGTNGVVMTPQTVGGSIRVMSDMAVKGDIYNMLDGNVYFKNSNNILKVVMLDNQALQLSYNGFTVDKYSIKDDFNYVTSVAIEDKDYIMASSKDNKKMYLIEKIDAGIFRKVKLEFTFTSRPFGISDRFIMGNRVYSVGNQNYTNARVILNPPLMSKQNNILLDDSSSITSVAVKFIDEDFDGIKEIKLSGRNTQQLKAPYQSNIYKIKTRLNLIKDGIKIDIMTKSNDKAIELLAVQGDVDVVENK